MTGTRVTTRTADFRIVVATDGSSQARAAIATVLAVPWPAETHVRAVIARQIRAPYSRSILLSALDQSADEGAARARRTLARRWPSAEAVVVEKAAVEGILHEAERFRADLVAVGWRGHGTARRLLMGSVSRGVVRGAKCAVLVVRQRPRRVRRIVIGFDGFAKCSARRAVGRQVGGAARRTRDARQRRGNPGTKLTRTSRRWHSVDDCP